MAKQNSYLGLPDSVMIDVVMTKGEKVCVKTMTIAESRFMIKKKGWTYKNYQVGHHSFKTNIKI